MSEAVKEYFEQTLPNMFKEKYEANPPADMDGEEVRYEYVIDDLKYGIRVKDGKTIEILPGGVEEPHIQNTIDTASIMDVLSGVMPLNPVIDYNMKKRIDKVKSLKGNFKLELSREDGSKFNSSTIFNGTTDPAVKVMSKLADYSQVVSGKLNPQMAFMTGKVKFEGSMPFLMLLGSLTN
jgi:putative sterol carrier protein